MNSSEIGDDAYAQYRGSISIKPEPVDILEKVRSDGIPMAKNEPKLVRFIHFPWKNSSVTARNDLPVFIKEKDATEDILETVRNWFDIPDRCRLGLEDAAMGVVLIPSYQNFRHNMEVWVRTDLEVNDADHPRLNPPFRAPTANTVSAEDVATINFIDSSAAANKRSAAAFASAPYAHDVGVDSDTSSRRSKKETSNSADISVDNIVDGDRRKKIKWDGNTLPLFKAPQRPLQSSISSASPQRPLITTPYSNHTARAFQYKQALPSPVSHVSDPIAFMQGPVSAVGRTPSKYHPNGSLITPDVSSDGSGKRRITEDEEIAWQLLRLGDPSNVSTRGRTSTSTIDDALSGKADGASSYGEGDSHAVSSYEGESEAETEGEGNTVNIGQPISKKPVSGHKSSHRRRSTKEDEPWVQNILAKADLPHWIPGMKQNDAQKGMTVADFLINNGHSKRFKESLPTELRDLVPGDGRRQQTRTKKTVARRKPTNAARTAGNPAQVPISPMSLPPPSRKQSVTSMAMSAPLADGIADLSSKPRCTRCRTSKKGCDRQRPCQRCKDAGIGIEGCISEDENNGRKGRYGRHMGVPVKNADGLGASADESYASIETGHASPTQSTFKVSDPSRKRKRAST